MPSSECVLFFTLSSNTSGSLLFALAHLRRRVMGRFASAMALAVAVVACKDPAADKPKATVGAPVATPTGSSGAGGATAAKPLSKYTISLADSKVEFTGSKVTGKHDGGFKTFSGSIEIDGDKVTSGKIKIEIDT